MVNFQVCKFTFMSKFAAVQHGIHNHPEYAENIDEIAEQVGIPGAGAKTDLRSPDIIEIVSPPRGKIKNMSTFFPNVGDSGDNRDIAAETDEAPLDLSQSNSNDDDIVERKDGSDGRKEPGVKSGPGGLSLPGPMFPPGLPYFLPGQTPFPLLPFYPGLMMPGLFSGDKEAQEKHLKEIMTRMQLQAAAGAAPRPPFPAPPSLAPGLDIASMMAAQAEAIRKQAELKQQQEAAETLQKLSQMHVLPGAGPAANKSTVNMSEEGTNSDSGAKGKETEAQYKMVMKNGVLMKKQKQRRYRTERPYSCQSCTARFTLRSNMERHIKQQHPETWGDKLKGSRRNFGNMTVPHISPELKEQLQHMDEAEADAEKEENDGEEEGELIIDDAPEDVEEDKPQPDLASISNLLNAANNQSFNQYFNGSQDEDTNTAKEQGESCSDTEAKDGERRSAYSAAPHKISCPFCARKFPWESSLKRHILTHTGQKPFKCTDCPLWFTTKSNCDRHQARKHGINNNIEDKDFEHGDDAMSGGEEEEEQGFLQEDQIPSRRDSASSEHPFKCHLCDDGFPDRSCAIEHLESSHAAEYQSLVEKGAFESPEEASPTQTHESGEELYDAIRGKFPDYVNRKIICLFCNRKFWSAEDLRRHVRTHTGERPYCCDICNRRFTLKHSMLRHKKKHDSGVSSNEMTSDDDTLSEHSSSSPASSLPSSSVSAPAQIYDQKRANLMEKISRLGAVPDGQ